MQDFRFYENPTLPPLSWCAKLARSAPSIIVEHGTGVVTEDDYFVEGAWKGDFDEGAFHTSEVMLGSGGACVGEDIVFTPTSHTMERLYSIALQDALYVSNSLVYLLQATGSKLDLRDWSYESKLMTFLRGHRRAVQQLRLAEGRIVRLHYRNPFRVDRSLSITSMQAHEPPAFDSYQHYIGYLIDTITQLYQNANAPRRAVGFTPITTVSSGYDSPACAVLAKHIGCRKSVTFADARVEFAPSMSDTDDSGAEIATHLGMDVEVFSRRDYLAQSECLEALFLATGSGGDDVVMGVLGESVRRSLLFTGTLGDTLWGLDEQPPELSKEFRFRFPAGGSLQEFRLSREFIHVPVPLLTFTRHAEIQVISRSDEMRPWRVGGNYDRPIPRRLVEECGVPREAFAREKRAITQPFWLQKSNPHCMSAASMEDYRSFLQKVARQYPFGDLQMRAHDRLRRLSCKFHRWKDKRNNPYFSPSYWSAAVSDPLRFHWAVEKVSYSYRTTRFSHVGRVDRPIGPLSASYD